MSHNGFDDFVAGLQKNIIGVVKLDHEIFFSMKIIDQSTIIRIPKMDWSVAPVIKKNGGIINITPVCQHAIDSDVHVALVLYSNGSMEFEYRIKHETGSDGIDHHVSIYRYANAERIALTLGEYQSSVYFPYGSCEFSVLNFVIETMVDIHKECVERLEL